jgi:uncharacterized protein (DUF302 family)
MLYTLNTKNDIDHTKNKLAEEAKKEGFGVLKEYRFKDILKEKGYPIQRDITVFEICNPPAAQSILDIYPEVSVFLPCRISLYKKDGLTTLSTIHIDNMLSNFTNLEEDTQKYMHTVFDKVKKIMKNLE